MVTGLDVDRENTATCRRKNPYYLRGVSLYLCRKIQCLGQGLLYDLDVANRAISRQVLATSFGLILTRVITAGQQQRHAERDGKCIK